MLHKSRGIKILALLCLGIWLTVSGCSSKSDKATDTVGVSEQANTAVAPQAKELAFSEATTSASGDSVAQADQIPEKLDVAGAGQGLEGTKGFTSAAATAEGWDRRVIFKGNLTMEVPDYAAAQTEINNLVTLAGGYVLLFSENQSTTEKSGNYVIKVPASGFSSFIRDLEKIKTVSDIRHNIQGQDVSEEYVDLSSRLKAKQVVEARLLAFMEKATKTAELLSFSNELGNVQETIEQIKGRMRYLDQNVAMSSVEIRLYQDGVHSSASVENSTLTKTKSALSGSIHALKLIAQGLIVFAAAVLPVLIVVAIIGFPLIILIRKNVKKKALNPTPAQANYVQKIDTSVDHPQDPA